MPFRKTNQIVKLKMEDKTMNLVKYFNPKPDLFDRFFNNDLLDWPNRHFSNTDTTLPSVNIKEDTDNFLVEMAAPGLKKEDFKIELDNNMLTISSEKKFENEESNGKQFTKREFSYQSFSRTFTLPNTVNRDKIEAKYDNGILEVVIPKKEEAKPKPAKTIKIS